MLVINSLASLEQFGIRYLTGEADALGFRGLCDLTERGRKIVAQALGIAETGFPENWNSKAVASCLLPFDMVPTLAIVAAALSGQTAIKTDHGVYILESGEDVLHAEYDENYNQTKPQRLIQAGVFEGEIPWPSFYGKIERIFRVPSGNQPREGLRNIHGFSGRSV